MVAPLLAQMFPTDGERDARAVSGSLGLPGKSEQSREALESDVRTRLNPSPFR